MVRGPTWIIPGVTIDLEVLDKKREWEEMGQHKYYVSTYRKFYASTHYTDGSRARKTGLTGVGIYIPDFKISLTKKYNLSGWNRKEEVIINRMRFGHSGLNASLFITGVH